MTITNEQVQDIYEAAVREEVAGNSDDTQQAVFDLLCLLDTTGGTGATIRKLIDMMRAANREAEPVAWTTPEELSEADCGDVWMWLAPRKYPGEIALYAVPPAPACSKCGGRGTYHDVGACGTVECECTLSPVPPVPVGLIDQVCNAAAGIYRQSDDDKAQAIIDSIRVMLAAPKGGK